VLEEFKSVESVEAVLHFWWPVHQLLLALLEFSMPA
jgi:hypothetical protein